MSATEVPATHVPSANDQVDKADRLALARWFLGERSGPENVAFYEREGFGMWEDALAAADRGLAALAAARGPSMVGEVAREPLSISGPGRGKTSPVEVTLVRGSVDASTTATLERKERFIDAGYAAGDAPRVGEETARRARAALDGEGYTGLDDEVIDIVLAAARSTTVKDHTTGPDPLLGAFQRPAEDLLPGVAGAVDAILGVDGSPAQRQEALARQVRAIVHHSHGEDHTVESLVSWLTTGPLLEARGTTETSAERRQAAETVVDQWLARRATDDGTGETTTAQALVADVLAALGEVSS